MTNSIFFNVEDHDWHKHFYITIIIKAKEDPFENPLTSEDHLYAYDGPSETRTRGQATWNTETEMIYNELGSRVESLLYEQNQTIKSTSEVNKNKEQWEYSMNGFRRPHDNGMEQSTVDCPDAFLCMIKRKGKHVFLKSD